MKKYKPQPEMVLFGTGSKLPENFIPEIKLRINKGKKFAHITSPEEVYHFLKKVYGVQVRLQELFVVLLLNRANDVMGFYKHTIGTSFSTQVDIKMLLGMILGSGAASVIISHNHPSGNKTPSDNDKALTKTFQEACKATSINLFDHVIVTEADYFSFANEGLLGLKGIGLAGVSFEGYKKDIQGIDFSKLPEPLREGHEFMLENGDLYSAAPEIKSYIDLYLEKLNNYLNKQKPAQKPPAEKKPAGKKHTVSKGAKKVLKSERKKASKPVREKKEKKAKKEKATDEQIQVPKIPIEVTFIKRFLLFNGKTKDREQVIRLLASLQKAILEEQITKKSKYAEEIMLVQDKLLDLAKMMDSRPANISFGFDISHLMSVINTFKQQHSTLLFKRFLTWYKKPFQEKSKAEKLLEAFDRLLESELIADDEKAQETEKAIRKCLKNFLETGKVSITEIALAGLKSCESCNGLGEILNQEITSSTDLLMVKFRPMNFSGKWQKLIGNPTEPFAVMITGKPGSGKSSLAIMFASYLANKHEKHCLYIAKEEGRGYTLQEKIKRLDASHPNFLIADSLPENIQNIQFIFIDSVNSHNLSPEDLVRIRKKHPAVSFVYIFKATKDGNFRGSQEYEHDVDVSIMTWTDESGRHSYAKAGKNRFGGSETIQIF